MPDALPQSAGVDAAGALLSILVYLAVGIGVYATAPRDIRARLFLLVALANVAPAGSTVVSWRYGAAALASRPLIAAVLASLAAGSTALFHFAQVFPGRRPWIERHGRIWLPILYILSPLAAVLLVAGAPTEVTELPVGYALALLLVGLPWLFIVLIVLPFAGLVSLYASWHATRNAGARIEARVTLLILISQLAGGVLGLIVVPLVRAVFPGSALVTAASVLLVACGLLMPLAFAVGVWRDHVLSR